MKLCVFDFDSTIMDGETIDNLAMRFGVGEEVKKITQKAMNAELDFFESLKRRVRLLEGLDYDEALDVCHNLPFMPGAKETICELKNLGYKVVVFSGGFRLATSHAKNILGFDAEFANILHVKNNRLTGEVGGEMMFEFSKGEMLERLQCLLGVSKENTIAVGDGANDRSMFEYAGKKVAFCAKEALKVHANIIIDEKNLRLILNHI